MSKDEQKISSLRDLPRSIEPPRDLWQGIEARLAAEPRGVANGVGASGTIHGAARGLGGVRGDAASGTGRATRANTLRLIGAAAVIAALVVGIWVGRTVLPPTGKPAGMGLNANVSAGEPEALRAAYVMDSRYTRQRAVLVQSLEAKLAELPPDSRAKVMSSLQTIQDSMRDLQAALGRDPTNALLQELLVNTYQDEMRVLTAVHEAGDAGKGI